MGICCAKAYQNKSLFTNLPDHVQRWNRKTKACHIASRVISTLTNFQKSYGVTKQLFRSRIQTSQKEFKGRFSFLKIMAFPRIVWGISGLCKEISRLNQDVKGASLGALKHLSELGISATVIISSLKEMDYATHAFRYVHALKIGSAILSSSKIIIQYRTLSVQSYNVTYLENCADHLSDIKQLLKEIKTNKEKGYFEIRYGISGKIMRRQLRKIYRTAKRDLRAGNTFEIRMRGRKTLAATLSNLRTRAKMQVYESRMALLSVSIGSLASILLALSSKASLTGPLYGLLAIGTGLQAYTLIHERVSCLKLNKCFV